MIPTALEMVPRLRLLSAVLLTAFLAPTSVFSQRPAPRAERAFAEAVRFYNLRSYTEATASLSSFRTQYPDHILSGEALYLQAQSALAQRQQPEAFRLFGALERTDPSHPRAAEAQLTVAQSLLEEGDTTAAREQLARTIESRSGPLAARALYLRGMNAREQGALGRALRDFERAYAEHPDSDVAPAALYNAGVTQVQMGRYEEAATSFETLGDRFPDAPLAQNMGTALAETYYRLGQFENAARELNDRLPQLDGDQRRRALFLLAESYTQLGRTEDAERTYQQVLTAAPTGPYAAPAAFGRAWNHYRAGSYAEAAEAFARLRQEHDGPLADRALYYEAASRAQGGAPSRALQLYERVPTRLSGRRLAAESHFERGLLLYQQERYADATAAFQSAVAEISNGSRLGDAYYWLGTARLAANQFDAALGAYDRAQEYGVRADSLTREAQFQRGYALYQDGQYEAAARDLQAIAEAQPSSARGADALFWSAESSFQQGALGRAREGFQRYLNAYPNGDQRAAARYTLGWTFFKQGRYEAAAQHFRQFLNAHGSDASDVRRRDARLRLADAYFAQKQYEQAVNTYGQVEGDGLDYATYQAGEALNFAGRPSEAIQTLERLAEQYPSSPWRAEALARIGAIHFQEQDYEAAREAYRRFLDAYPDHSRAPEAEYSIADSYYNAGNMDAAVQAYREVIEDYPEREIVEEAASGLFFALEAEGRSERADALIDSVAAAAPDANLRDRLRFQRAKAAFQRGDSERALSLFREFVQTSTLDSLLPQAYYFLGQLYADQSSPTEATNYFRQLVEQYPGSDRFPDAALRLGDLERERENYEAAVEAYRAAAESDRIVDALRARARYGEATALLALDRPDDAEALLENLLDEDERGLLQATARLGLGRVYEAQGQVDDALDLYRRVVTADDGEAGAEALYRLGRLLRTQNRPEAALRELDRMGSLFPGRPEWQARALLEQARAYRALGETGQAVQLYENVVDSYPGTPFAETARSEQDAL